MSAGILFKKYIKKGLQWGQIGLKKSRQICNRKKLSNCLIILGLTMIKICLSSDRHGQTNTFYCQEINLKTLYVSLEHTDKNIQIWADKKQTKYNTCLLITKHKHK